MGEVFVLIARMSAVKTWDGGIARSLLTAEGQS